MTNFVVDAYAWIEYLEGSQKGKKVTEIVENSSNEIFTSSTTIAEVISKFLRTSKDIKIALTAINTLSTIIAISNEISALAGQIHFEAKKKNKEFGMLDAFVAATAKKIGAKILTGDNDFKNFKEAVMI
ncbi:PIN domain-containing protein [Candidatus Woesearchaeota archaeon]|nr:PIN domain-containing protein [Candidatus Woesearchaeota archaeon]